eukprot:1893426-Pyramimonas_sp.AAC.3
MERYSQRRLLIGHVESGDSRVEQPTYWPTLPYCEDELNRHLAFFAGAAFEPSQAEMDAYMKKMGISRAANHHMGRPSSRGKVVDDDDDGGGGEEDPSALRHSRSFDHLRSSTQVRPPMPRPGET